MKHSRIFRIDGSEIMKITVTLEDGGTNGYDHFYIGVANYHLKGNSGEEKLVFEKKVYKMISFGGISAEMLTKYWPEVLPLLVVNGCDTFGVPSYPIINSEYHLRENIDYAQKTLRITPLEALKLADFKKLSLCNYIINNLLPRYEQESAEAIKVLEGLTGETYIKTDKVSPSLYNDMHFCFVTTHKGWNVYKENKETIKDYGI